MKHTTADEDGGKRRLQDEAMGERHSGVLAGG